MRCPSCKKDGAFLPWEGPLKLMGLEVLGRGMRCPCGEILFSDGEVQRQERELASALVARGIRTAAEFKFVRKIAELRAVEVAEMLDVRPETVSRWERGETDIPRLAAFALGELFERPQAVRQRLAGAAR